MRAKATSPLLTLAHRWGACNERLFRTGRIEDRGQEKLEGRALPFGATLSGGLGEVLQGSRLGGSATAGGQFPNVVEEDGALEVV
jgi:hypothetical protein